MPRRIRISPQRLPRIIRPINPKLTPEPKNPSMLSIQLRHRPDSRIEMHVLDRPSLRPGSRRHLRSVDLIERERPTPVGPGEDQPVSGLLPFVTRTVDESEQLAVELREAAYVGGVEDRLGQLRHVAYLRGGPSQRGVLLR